MNLLESAFAALLVSGPIGLFAALELLAIMALGGVVWYFIRQKNGHAVLTRQHSSEMKKLQEGHLSKINDLHANYQKQLADLNSQRIADVKEMSDDYSELAERMTDTIGRLNHQLEIRGSVKGG